jgi:hypothetical protein
MIAWLKGLKLNREQTMACHEKTEARLEEEKPASMELKPEVADEEVPYLCQQENRENESGPTTSGRTAPPEEGMEAYPEEGWVSKNFVAARRAAVAWRRINFFRKNLTHGFCGLRKEVTAAGMRITRCAGHGRKGRNKKIVIERNRIKRREPKK